MEFAIDFAGRRIHASCADKQREYFCPVCRHKVIPRQGKVNIDHYAHTSPCDDTWSYDMSEWHKDWQSQFPYGNREIVVTVSEEKHRADVMAYGYVIEFQHSPITAEEFNERNNFYLHSGKKVIWIFDFRKEFSSHRIKCYDEWKNSNDNGGKFNWKYPKRFLQDYIPQNRKDIIVFFQFEDAKHGDSEVFYIERITWAIIEDGQSNFKRFCTSYYPGNVTELLDYMKNKKL